MKPTPQREYVCPHLIVLVRSHPEEAILVGCKKSSNSGGAYAFNESCFMGSNNCSTWCTENNPT